MIPVPGILSGVASAFILGAVFWAGALYNSIRRMQDELHEIKESLKGFANFTAVEQLGQSNERRISALEEAARG